MANHKKSIIKRKADYYHKNFKLDTEDTIGVRADPAIRVIMWLISSVYESMVSHTVKPLTFLIYTVELHRMQQIVVWNKMKRKSDCHIVHVSNMGNFKELWMKMVKILSSHLKTRIQIDEILAFPKTTTNFFN